MFLQILSVLLPVFFVLLLGYFAGRAKAFDSDQVAGLSELVLDFALPASLFVGTVRTPRTRARMGAEHWPPALWRIFGLRRASQDCQWTCDHKDSYAELAWILRL